MIRLFTALCKALLGATSEITDEQLFQEATYGFAYSGKRCPQCGAKGELAPYGDYPRRLVSRRRGKPADIRIWPHRFKCGSCDATHALLPDILVPYSPYALQFKLSVLIAYFEKTTPVVNVCESFGIAVSTLYRWLTLMLEHKELMLGVLISRKASAPGFLQGLLDSEDLSDMLRRFFSKYGFSFMQAPPVIATRTHPP